MSPQHAPCLLLQFAHADQVLRDLREALLALVCQKLWPVLQMRVNLLRTSFSVHFIIVSLHRDLLQRLLIVSVQLDAFPQLCRCVCTLNRLQAQVRNAYRNNTQM